MVLRRPIHPHRLAIAHHLLFLPSAQLVQRHNQMEPVCSLDPQATALARHILEQRPAIAAVQAILARHQALVERRQIARLEQQPNRTEHVWKQGRHLEAHHMILDLATVADQASQRLRALRVMERDQALARQQIALLVQQPNLMVPVWKADQLHTEAIHLTVTSILAEASNYIRVMQLFLQRRHMDIIQMGAMAPLIILRFGNRLATFSKHPLGIAVAGFLLPRRPVNHILRLIQLTVNGAYGR